MGTSKPGRWLRSMEGKLLMQAIHEWSRGVALQAYRIPETSRVLFGNEAAPTVEQERTKELLLTFGHTQVQGITWDAPKGVP